MESVAKEMSDLNISEQEVEEVKVETQVVEEPVHS